MRDGFIFYGSFADAIWDLPDEQRLAAYDAVSRYALTGELPQESGIVGTLFKLMKPQIDANNERRENGKKGGRPKKKTNGFEEIKTNGFENEKPKEKEKYKEKDKEKYKAKEKDKEKRFMRPTVEEVDAYCRERGNNVDAQSFIDFYESKGWKVGNSPMKDWKACVRTWEGRNKKVARSGTFQIESRKYDMDAFEKELTDAVDYSG